MEEILRFLEKYELWIYIITGVVGLFYLRRMVLAWSQWRGAIFGLEREGAQRRFSSAMTALILISLFIMAEFILVSFVSPALPQSMALPTPTLDLLATATATLAPGESTPVPPAAEVLALATTQVGSCINGELEWDEPSPGEEIFGTVSLKGTVNIPNFGFYKYEYSQPGSELWTTIAAGNQVRINQEIGSWNTSQMVPGDYLLRLVAVDNENNPRPACVVQIRIVPEPE